MIKIFDKDFLYEIVVPSAPTGEERYAAETLQKYLQEIAGGGTLEITAESAEDNRNGKIYIGNVAAMRDLFLSERENLGQDEFAIRFSAGDVFLFDKANKYSSAGIIYAAHEFLERFTGVRFFSYDEEFVPRKKVIEFEGRDVYEKPDFIMRQHLASATRKYPDYAVKMRIKDCFCPDTPGGALEPLWAKGKMWHNLYELIPPEKYKDAHPEWFDEKSEQLCFSDEALTDEIFEVMKKKIEENPDSRFFPISQNDTDKPCGCERCKAEYEKYTVSGTLIRFVNRVAKKVEKWLSETHPERRDVYIPTFAYYFTADPPVKKENGVFAPIDESVVPNDNVYIFFTTIDHCFFHRHDDVSCEWNKNFSDRLDGWKSLVGERFIYWTYSSNFSHYLYPFFNFGTMAHDFRLLKAAGGKYMLDQASCEVEYVNFSELRTYMASKLLWNVNADEKTLMNDFIDAYYKAAAPEVKEYISEYQKHLESLAEHNGYHLRVFMLPDSMYDYRNFPLAFLGKLDKIFERGMKKLEAEGVAPNGVLMLRLRRVWLYVKYLYVINYGNYFPDSSESEKTKFIDGFLAECAECGIDRYKEYFKDNMSELREKALKGELLKY